MCERWLKRHPTVSATTGRERQHSTLEPFNSENRLFIVCANVSIDFFVIYVIPISIEFPVAWKFQARCFFALTLSPGLAGC